MAKFIKHKYIIEDDDITMLPDDNNLRNKKKITHKSKYN